MAPTKQDYYAVLGLANDASDNAIRAAYKKLALQWHPDRHLVDKERVAQKFIEVNQAYHALMDGKESTHSSSSSSTDVSSSTSATNSTEPTHSDSQSKNNSQASSRPPSASSNSSKRSNQSSAKSSSKPSDSHHAKASKPSPQSTTPPTPSGSSFTRDRKSGSHSRQDKPNRMDEKRPSSDRMKSGRKFPKSHDHIKDPPGSGTSPTASSASRSSERLDGSVRSKSSEKATTSCSTETQHDSRPDKTCRSRSGTSRASKPVIPPPSGRLHKSSKLGDEFVQKLSRAGAKGKKACSESPPYERESTLHGTPLHAINTPRTASKEWIFPLALTLDEMYHGTSYKFLVTRELLSGQKEQVEISIAIPSGMRSGTRIVCPRTGHQRKDGALQDIVFLVEEIPDERFSRVKDDLFVDVCVPWADGLADEGGELCVYGIDGKEITFALPYPIYDQVTEGQVLVKGAGMPIRDGRKTVGRGDMIVRWRVVFPAHQSKWQTFKKAIHLDL